MKILLLAPFPYGAASGHGGAVVCSAMLRQLAEQHELQVLCFSQGGDADAAALHEMRTLVAVQTVPLHISKWRVITCKLGSLLGGVPEHALYHESAAYHLELQGLLSDFRPDLVITQFPQMAQYLSDLGGCLAVHDVQDAFSVSWFRRAVSTRNWSRWYGLRQWRAWLDYERRWYPKAAQVWALSEQDCAGLRVFSPQLDAQSIGIPLLDLAQQSAALPAPAIPAVGFIASFGHAPNLEALHLLLEHIEPLLSARMPGLQFLIAGRNPPAALVAAAPANVRYLGFVDSVADFYAQCTVVLAPLLSGGGVKIKVAEAMGHGRAVVTTSVGAEGIGIANGTHAIVADTADTLADGVHALLTDSPRRERIAAAGRDLALQQYSVHAWRERVGSLIEQISSKRALT